jgi:uncharacterized membrane protein YhdT
MSSAPHSREPSLDPLYLNARRELVYILAVFAVCATWAVSICYLDGYRAAGEAIGEIPMVLGMPRWVFWGIFVPWLFADMATIWFCFAVMSDDDLGSEKSDQDREDPNA